jgi:chromosome segregation protein
VAAAAERVRAEADAEPEALLDRAGTDAQDVPSAGALEAEVQRLRRARDALGAVNLRAEEDARLVEEEHASLARDRADLEEAIRKLRQGIASLNREGGCGCSTPSRRSTAISRRCSRGSSAAARRR